MRRFTGLAALFAGLASISIPAPAAVFCVFNSTELAAALQVAAVNGSDDSIRIRIGSHQAPPGGFVYDARSGDDRSIAISGGWVGNPFNQCASQIRDPRRTTLDGNDINPVLAVIVRANSNVHVSLLTFAFGHNTSPAAPGGGLYLRSFEPHAGRMDVERNIFYGNSADFAGGLSAFNTASGTGRLYVVNNLFLLNHSHNDVGAAEIGLNHGHVYISNNTVLANTSSGDFGAASGGIRVGGSGRFLIANNNLWGNQLSDLELETSQVDLIHNNIDVRVGVEPETAFGNISVQPEYDDELASFTPVRSSPLVDAGTTPPTIGVPPFFWYLSGFDLYGSTRVVGPSVDIGAFENERIFNAGFDPPGPFAADDAVAMTCASVDCLSGAPGDRP